MLGLNDILALLDGSPFGVSVSRRSDGVVVFANRAFTAMLGVEKDNFIGTKARDWFVDDAQRESIVRQLKRDGAVDNAEVQFRKADGQPFWVIMTLRATDLGGEAVNLAWMCDITERRATEDRLRLAAKVVETANEGIVITNDEGRIEAVNAAFTRITGYTAEDVVGHKPNVLKSGRHGHEFYLAMWDEIARTGRWVGEVWNRRRDGEVYIEWLSIAAVRDAAQKVTHYLGIFSDITARKEDEEHIWRQANFDPLTGLPNRALFLDRLAMAVRQSQREGMPFALLFIDLDGFKAVNDTYGHATGDLLLQEAGARIARGVRLSDTVARLSGDEFTVIVQNLSSREDAAAIAAKIVERIAAPFHLDGHVANVCASVGGAVFPDDTEDLNVLIKLADQAMYGVKRGGKNGFAFTSMVKQLADSRM